jgi:ribosomal protein S18 acetylase RimI-like enzyme
MAVPGDQTVKLQLRPIRESDQPFLRDLYGSTREEELQQTGWSQEELDKFIDFQHNAQHTHYMREYSKAQFDIILADGEKVGRLYVDRRKDEIRIVDIALLTRHRGKGWGSYYLLQLLEEGRQKNQPVRIHVEHNNPALNLYKRLGFKQMDTNGVYLLMERVPESVSL